MNNLHQIPENLPVPTDDGAADHLTREKLPSIFLTATDGTQIDLSQLQGKAVVFIFPRTGRPGVNPLVSDWDMIPGARGCTPQTCAFRDLKAEFAALSCQIFGLSTQDPAYQKEMSNRLHLPFPVLSDSELKLTKALHLPVMNVAGQTLLRRMAWVANDGVIEKVFYPVFPPDQNAAKVLSWLRP